MSLAYEGLCNLLSSYKRKDDVVPLQALLALKVRIEASGEEKPSSIVNLNEDKDGKRGGFLPRQAEPIAVKCRHNQNAEGHYDPELTRGNIYKVITATIPAMSGDSVETYISIIGNSGVEILRPKAHFELVYLNTHLLKR